jgi:Fungalysin metallopeptidase (M36)
LRSVYTKDALKQHTTQELFVAINFIPNDPLAQAFVPMRQISPRNNRPAAQAGFTFFDAVAEGLFAIGTPQFLFWQCREAALLALEVWETLNGPLREWSSEAVDQKRLQLVQNAGVRLNAFYDRQSLAFFEHTTGTKTTFSGASTDVVAHEAGHALLDALRPELFDGSFTESGALHEAFGDCIAILVALFDDETRKALLKASPDLGAANFVEATAEDLSNGIKLDKGASHPAAAPRQALNTFKFQLPTTLPTSGPPNVLTSEIHSFGRIFSGCFYDLIRNLFAESATQDSAALLAAAKTAGTLLVQGLRQAPETPRFFQSVGRAMVLIDDDTNGGAHRQAIGKAFAAHGVLLGSQSALMPKVALAGAAPKMAAKATSLAASTIKDIKRRIAADPRARMSIAPIRVGAARFVEAVHHRQVDLSSLGKKLKGVMAVAPEPVVVGASGGAAAAFSALPDASTTTDEVLKFVETLLANGRIRLDGAKVAKSALAGGRAGAASVGVSEEQPLPTHAVRTQGGKKVLKRVRFLCWCHR